MMYPSEPSSSSQPQPTTFVDDETKISAIAEEKAPPMINEAASHEPPFFPCMSVLYDMDPHIQVLEQRQREGIQFPVDHPRRLGEAVVARAMNAQIYEKALRGDDDLLEDMENGVLNQLSPQLNSVLHIVAKEGHDRLVSRILDISPNHLIQLGNQNVDLPLHFAASAGKLSTVNLLVSFSDRVFLHLLRVENNEKKTPLHHAVENGHKEVASFLVDADSDVCLSLNSNGTSPLHMAVKAGWADLVTQMDANAHKQIPDESLVHSAVRAKNIEIIEIMLNKQPHLLKSFDRQGRTPLSLAAYLGDDGLLDFFINSYSLELFQSDLAGNFPIHEAAARGHLKIIKKILHHRKESRELLNGQRRNFLHVAAINGRHNLIKYRLKTSELECLLNEKDSDGNSPLLLATIHKQPKVVYYLTWDKRVKLEQVNGHGLTALDAAEEHIVTTSISPAANLAVFDVH